MPPLPVGFGPEVDIVGKDDAEPMGSSVGSVGDSVGCVGAFVGSEPPVEPPSTGGTVIGTPFSLHSATRVAEAATLE